MLSNVPGEILLFLLIIFFLVAILVVLGGTVWAVTKAKIEKSKSSKNNIIMTVVFIFIAAISWLLNFGWLRFIMTFMLIPFTHAIIFFLANLHVGKYLDKSTKIKKINLCFMITYLATYIFFPDGADYGGMYFFFGLIHNDILSIIAMCISYIAGLSHIILFIVQLVQIIKIKKSIKCNL